MMKHTAEFYGNKLIIYGGKIAINQKSDQNNKIYVLNLENSAFFTVQNFVAPTSIPRARTWHQSFVEVDNLYIIGGWDGKNQCNDFSSINLREIFNHINDFSVKINTMEEDIEEEASMLSKNFQLMQNNRLIKINSMRQDTEDNNDENDNESFIDITKFCEWQLVEGKGQLFTPRYIYLFKVKKLIINILFFFLNQNWTLC